MFVLITREFSEGQDMCSIKVLTNNKILLTKGNSAKFCLVH